MGHGGLHALWQQPTERNLGPKAETPVLWPPHAKSWLIGKVSDAGRDWRQEEKGTTEDEMAGWHHWLDGCESEWTWGVGDEQGGLACCDSWGRKELDTTEQLNWTELNWWCCMHYGNWRNRWELCFPIREVALLERETSGTQVFISACSLS